MRSPAPLAADGRKPARSKLPGRRWDNAKALFSGERADFSKVVGAQATRMEAAVNGDLSPEARATYWPNSFAPSGKNFSRNSGTGG